MAWKGKVHMEVKECVEEMEEKLWEVLNIMQLFKEAVTAGNEDVYIQRGISTLERMVKSICEDDICKLKEILP